MVIIFSSDFETGDFLGFDDVIGTATVQQNLPRSGIFNAVFSTPAVDGYIYATCIKRFSPQKTMSAEGFFFLNSSLPLPQQDTDRFYFIILQGTEAVAFAGILQTGTGSKWELMIRNGTEYILKTAGSPVSGRYYHVKVVWHNDPINGWAQLYVDGTLIAEIMGVDTSSYGDCTQANFGIAQKSGTAFPVEVFADDIVITGEPPSVLLSYESTPILVESIIDGVTVPSGGSVQVVTDSLVTISAPSQVGTYYFNHLLINGTAYMTNPIQITVTADMNVIAVYAEEKPAEIALAPFAVGTGIGIALIIAGIFS